MKKNKVIVILGPTASGKTKLAVELAKRFNGEIISADSRQVYVGMDIGTGKDLQEYGKIACHMIDVVSPKADFSVGQWQKLAYKAIDDILARDKTPIVCGGTGLYISALVEGYQLPETNISTKKFLELRKKLDKLSLPRLLAKLKRIDLETYNIIDKNNKRRVQRALEIYYQTGKKKSVQQIKIKPPYKFLILGLIWPKEILRQRIAERLVERLEKEGMLEEVKKLHKQGVSWRRLEAFGLEYRWLSWYLQKKISYSEMFVGLSQAINNFAKRQLTWFKRDKKIIWLKKSRQAKARARIFLTK